MEDLIAENLEEAVEPAFLMLPLLPHQFVAKVVAQEPAASRERQRQLLRAANPLGSAGKEAFEELRDGLDAIVAETKPAIVEVGRVAQPFALRRAKFVDPDEIEVVGQDDVAGEALVFGDLLRLEHLGEVFVDPLVLDIAENEPALTDLEIRRTLVGYPLGLMLDLDALRGLGRHLLKQRLERTAVRVFRLIFNSCRAQRQNIAIEQLFIGHALLPPTLPEGYRGLNTGASSRSLDSQAGETFAAKAPTQNTAFQSRFMLTTVKP